MTHIGKRVARISILLVGGALAGCAADLSPDPAFQHVAMIVEERSGKRIEWDSTSEYAIIAKAHVDHVLSRELSSASAVQIALLNNRSLQSAYATLGIAQADVVQAGLLTNPVLDGDVVWPFQPEAAAGNLAIGVVFNFIELFWKRYKIAAAESALEEAKLQIAGLVIDHAAKTNLAFVQYVAKEQEIELFQQVVASARATVASAKAIREAGNSTPLDFEQQQNVLTQAKLDLAGAEAAAASAREALNELMGLTGEQTHWRAPKRLPSVKAGETATSGVEARAVERSLELAALRQKLITLAYKYRFTDRMALVPDLGLGPQYENKGSAEGREQELGLRFDVTLPLFDQGQAKRARSVFEIRQAQDAYWAMAVRVRSVARLSAAALETTRKTALYYERAVLPQQARLLDATTRQYNAMQEDVFQLIRARRSQIEAGRNYIDALKAYWGARVRFQQLLSGRLPDSAGGMVIASAAPAEAGVGGH